MEKLRDDLVGGLVSAAVAVPLAIGFGMFAFVAVGDAYFAYGAVSGLYAAMVLGVASVALGDRTTTVYAPRVTTTFFLGGVLYQLVHSDIEILRSGGHHIVILAFFSIVLLGGLLQALFGLIRLGSVLRFTPHPVMAGLQNAAAALLFLVQLGNVAGFESNIPFTAILSHLAEAKPLSALALAIIAALDALLCAKLVTPPGAAKIDGDRLLFRLGAGNALSACFGGITSGINIGATLVNRSFGAKSWVSVLINAAALLLVIAVAFPAVAQMPRVVLSAAIMVIAVQHVDPWSIDLVQRIRNRAARHRGPMLLDLAVVILVAALSVTIDIVLAVFLGVVIAVALFVLRMSRSNIRRTYRCDGVHSRKAHTPAQVAALERDGSCILVLELHGALFFGSAETLSDEIDKAAGGTRAVILDLRRVTEIDATGAQILAEIAAAQARNERQLGVAIIRNSEVAARLDEAGVLDALEGRVFGDVDRAIEWAEDGLLHETSGAAPAEIPLAGAAVLRDLSFQEAEILAAHTRRVSFSRGTEIFREGDPGKELFVLVQGRASVYLQQPDGAIRLATFAPGTIFGELAILDAGPRSATVVADEDVVCHVLSGSDFAALSDAAPAVAIKLLAGLGRELSMRLRRANKTIHQLES